MLPPLLFAAYGVSHTAGRIECILEILRSPSRDRILDAPVAIFTLQDLQRSAPVPWVLPVDAEPAIVRRHPEPEKGGHPIRFLKGLGARVVLTPGGHRDVFAIDEDPLRRFHAACRVEH